MKTPTAHRNQDIASYVFTTPHAPSHYGQTTILVSSEDWANPAPAQAMQAIIPQGKGKLVVSFTTAITLDAQLAKTVLNLIERKGINGVLNSGSKSIPASLKSAFKGIVNAPSHTETTCHDVKWVGTSASISGILSQQEFLQAAQIQRVMRDTLNEASTLFIERFIEGLGADRAEAPELHS